MSKPLFRSTQSGRGFAGCRLRAGSENRQAGSRDFAVFPFVRTRKRPCYRARETFDMLLAWLKRHGVASRNRIHILRKEFGSQIVKQHDIFSASIALRHASIVMTARTYAKKPGPISFALGKMLGGDEGK